MEVLLISEKVLKSVGLINDNVDGVYLQPAMVLAQEVGLQEIIGTTLLKKLKKLISNNTINDESNSDYKLLLTDYIKNYLIWETTSEIQVPVSFKTTNSGAIQNQDNQKTGVAIKDVEYLKEYYKDKARFFGKLLSDFLCVNSAKYPEFHKCTPGGVHSHTHDYCNIVFPDC